MNNRSPLLFATILALCMLCTPLYTAPALAQAKPAPQKPAPKAASTKPPPPAPAYSPEDLKILKQFTTTMNRDLLELQKASASGRPYTIEQALRAIPGPKTAGNIFRWVAENIGFEPYAGALRGPEGTLIAGSANSVDQALLLNEMLTKSGHKTRFVQGTIQDYDLFQTLRGFTGSARLLAPNNPDLLAEFAPEDYTERFQYTQLLSHHIWIEVLQPDGTYLPADPVLAPLFGMTPAIAISRSDILPPLFQASLELQLIARVNDDQELTVLNIAGPLENYAFRTLSLGFTPDDTQKHAVRPTLKLDNRAAIDQGELFSNEQLKNLEVRYTMKIGRTESRWTQTLFKSKPEQQPTQTTDLTQQHFAISFIPGWTANDQLTRVTHQSLSQLTTQLNQLAKNKRSTDISPEQTLHLALAELAPVIHFSYLRNLDRLTFELSGITGVRPILQSPRVVTTAITRQDNNELAITLDLQGDTLESMPMNGVPSVAATGLLTLYGRLKNQLESELLATASTSTRTSIDSIFRQARNEKIPFTTLHATRMDFLDQVQVDKKTRGELQDLAVNRGMVLLLPTRSVHVQNVEHYGWWTLKPQNGALEGHHQRALFSTQPTSPATISERLQSTINLSTQLQEIVQQTLGNTTQQAPLICKASRDIQRLSAGMCATTRSQKMPTLKECLQSQSTPVDNIASPKDLLSFATPDCEQQLKETRCGAIITSALLNGTLAIGAPEIPQMTEPQDTQQQDTQPQQADDSTAESTTEPQTIADATELQALTITPYCP